MFNLTANQSVLVGCAALITGFSKTGVGGLGILAVPMMASVFPAKESTGILLPMLIFADLFAILFYRRYANWRILVRLFPFVVGGIVIGYFFMDRISSRHLKPVIGFIVMGMMGIHVFLKCRAGHSIKKNSAFAGVVGILAGFSTMTANAAGPIMSIYLLAMDLDKTTFVGSRAWYYFLLNLFKVPFSVSLGLITLQSLQFNLHVFPLVLVGALLGYWLIKVIPQKWFEAAVLVLTAIGALNLVASIF